MKYKLAFVIAAIALIAAGCKNKTEDTQNNEQTNQQQEQTGDNNSIVVGEPNPSQPEREEKKPAQNTSEPVFSGEPGSDVVPQPEVREVQMTDSGFSPARLEIMKGDYVQFVNKSSGNIWPASAPHPAHTNYPGFDSKRGIAPGETWTFEFDKIGEWAYHDHLKTSVYGKIVVK